MAIAGLVIGYLGLTIIPVAILAAIALPAFTAVQEKATEIRSLSNAKQIGMACRQYANDNHGSFPPNLDALFPTYLPNRAVLVSPLMPADPDGYTYTDGLTESSPANTILIEDKYGSTKHVRLVVYVDDSAQVIRSP